MRRFSIIVPTHNRVDFLRECLDSIFAQTFVDYETIVVDDASTDSTPELLESVKDRVRSLRVAARADWATRNAGAAIANGEYLVFLDDDDLMFPWALAVYDQLISKQVPALLLGEQLTCRQDETYALPEEPNAIRYVSFPGFIQKDRTCTVTCSIMVLPATTFARVGGFQNCHTHSDLDLLLRLGLENPTLKLLSPATVAYRLHAGNTVRDLDQGCRGIESVLARERADHYPGGRKARRQRSAVIGGAAFYWAIRTLRGGRPRLSLRILRLGGSRILVAVWNRLKVKILGGYGTQSMPFDRKAGVTEDDPIRENHPVGHPISG